MSLELTPDLQFRLTEMVVHAAEITAEIAIGGLPTRMLFSTSTAYGSPMSLEGWSLEAATYDDNDDPAWELALHLDAYDACDHSTDGALVFTKGDHRLTLTYSLPMNESED
jgi:hypothetical protein